MSHFKFRIDGHPRSIAEIQCFACDVCPSHLWILALYLFGSVAKGKSRPHDYDIAVLFDEDIIPDKLTMYKRADEFYPILQERLKPLDLVESNLAPIRLADEIMRTGVLLYSKDDDSRRAWEKKKKLMIWDFMPVYEAYLSAVIDKRWGDKK